MNKDESFDLKVRERLKNDVNSIPENISNIFNISSSQIRKGKNKSYKRVAGMLIFFLLLTMVLGITIAPYADEIPILRDIFANLKLNGVEKQLNIDLSNIQLNYNVNSVTTTENNIVLEASNTYYGNTILYFEAYDENGNYIPDEDRETIQFWKGNKNQQEYIAYKFQKPKDVKTVTFIPYICVFQVGNPDNFDEAYDITPSGEGGRMEVSLNLNGVTKLTTKDGKDYGEISKIEVQEDKSYLYYKPISGGYNTIFEQIYNSNKTYEAAYLVDDYYQNKIPTTKYINETGEFKIELTKPLTEEAYTLVYYDYSNIQMYYYDKAFTVDLTN